MAPAAGCASALPASARARSRRRPEAMSRSTRRDFLKGALATGALAGIAPQAPAAKSEKRSATDWVTLGKSGIKVTRLAFGTGTHGGRIQRELGQPEFTKLVRH